MLENESSDGHEAEEYVGLADFVAEGDEQVQASVLMMIAFLNKHRFHCH